MSQELDILIKGVIVALIVVGAWGVLIGPFALPGVVLISIAIGSHFLMKAIWRKYE
jgi:hypothetical protein